MIRKISIAFAAVVLAFLSGCNTYRGVNEFAAYRIAFQSAKASSDAILDKLAVAERSLYSRCVNIRDIVKNEEEECEEFDPQVHGFNPDDAYYIVEVGDPPGTAAYRRTMRAVNAYTEVLNGLASGQTADALAIQLGELAAVGVSAASVAVPVAGVNDDLLKSVNAVNAAISALKPLTTQVIAFRTRAEFRDEILAQKDNLRKALNEVRSGAGLMYSALITDILDKAPPKGLPKSDIIVINNYRVLLANWVVILNATIDAFDIAVLAVENENTASVSGLLRASKDITEAAEEARRALAGSPGRNR